MTASATAHPTVRRSRLPVIQQSELAECGLACLAMIGRYHGHDIDLPSLRRRFPISLKGATLGNLISVAEKLGLETRPLRVELDYLPRLQTPCILHWNLNHFVVLKRVTRKGIEIHDPARGVRFVPMAEASRCFTGIALELRPGIEFAPISARRRLSLRSLAGRIVGLRAALAQILLLALVLEALTLALPLAMQWVLDTVLVSADLSLLSLLGVGFVFIVLFQSATLAMRGWIVAGVGASISAQWVTNLFGHLMRLPLGFFEKRHVGDVMSRFVSVQLIQQTLTGSFVGALLDGLTVALVLVVLTLYSPGLTVLVLAAFALYVTLRWAFYRRLYLLNEERLVYTARQQSQMLEAIQGAMSIKLGNRQDERRARVANNAIEVANREAAIQRVSSSFGALSKLIFGLQRVLLIWIGVWMAIEGRFTAGMMVVFVAYADMFAQRAGALIDRWVDLRMLRLHAERIADIALEAPESGLRTGYVGPTPQPTLEVEGLGFRYAEDEPWVLRNCSFRIAAGESVAVVGPSGCGKTTLAKLLLGLLEPTEGTIRIGGIELRRYGLEAHRGLFGVVMQDDALFAGSIADNIAFFDSESDLPRIEAAARLAQIHEDIVAMPMGYETLVGDMGSSLSGGQRQRVLLARALYRNPSLLLLDEATSHLDVAREHAINRAIATLDLTRIVIAHRPDTIASAERVIALVDGSAVALSAAEYLESRAAHGAPSEGATPRASVRLKLGEPIA